MLVVGRRLPRRSAWGPAEGARSANLARRVPALGERLRVYQLARFYRTVGMLLRGGTPVVTAFGMVSGLLPEAMRPQLADATQRVREGASLSAAMEETGLDHAGRGADAAGRREQRRAWRR